MNLTYSATPNVDFKVVVKNTDRQGSQPWAGSFGIVVGVDRAGQADALRQHGADVVVKDLAELLDAG